jgi:leader peptidase (prepilin peptidase)/N-methyltransferase
MDAAAPVPRSFAVLCAAGGGLAIGVSVWRLGGSWAVVPFALLAVVAARLAWVDLRERRLPNAIVLPSGAASMVLLGLAAIGDGQPTRWLGAVAGAAALFALYLALALAAPTGMGMGDVKLAAVVGLYGGWLGLTGWFAAALAGFVLGGIVAIVGLLRGARDIPFGPWMLAGLYVALALTTPTGRP